MVSQSAAAIYLAIAATALMAHAMPTSDSTLVSAPAVIGGAGVVTASGQRVAPTDTDIAAGADNKATRGRGGDNGQDDQSRRDGDDADASPRRGRSASLKGTFDDRAPRGGYRGDSHRGTYDDRAPVEDCSSVDEDSCRETSCSDDSDSDDCRSTVRDSSCESTDRYRSVRRRHRRYRGFNGRRTQRDTRYRQDRWSGNDTDCDDNTDVDHSYGGASPYGGRRGDHGGYGHSPYGGVSPYEAGGGYDGGDGYGVDDYADSRYGGDYQGYAGDYGRDDNADHGGYGGNDGGYGGDDDGGYGGNGGRRPAPKGRQPTQSHNREYSQDEYAANASQHSVDIADRRQGRYAASERHADESSLHRSGEERVMVDRFGQRAASRQEEIDAERRSADARQVHINGPRGSLDHSERDASEDTFSGDRSERTFVGPNRRATERSFSTSTTSRDMHTEETHIRGKPSFRQ